MNWFVHRLRRLGPTQSFNFNFNLFGINWESTKSNFDENVAANHQATEFKANHSGQQFTATARNVGEHCEWIFSAFYRYSKLSYSPVDSAFDFITLNLLGHPYRVWMLNYVRRCSKRISKLINFYRLTTSLRKRHCTKCWKCRSAWTHKRKNAVIDSAPTL